jgi:hypothetical protein
MIIFGWWYLTTKIFGPVFKNLCSNCNNEGYWVVKKVTKWFTIFFIPVFPYSTEYFLYCPTCEHGLYLNSQQIDEMVPIAKINQLLIDWKITEDEYHIRIKSLWNNEENKTIDTTPETKRLPSKKEGIKFCGNCWSEIKKTAKFCGNCGEKITKK